MMQNPRTAACTIVSPNYLPFARTVAQAYCRHHPGHEFFVLIVADLHDPAPFAGQPFQTVMLPALGIPNLRAEAMKYEILELNTNVKPSFLKHLLAQGFDQVVYLDPDILVTAPLTPVFEALQRADAALTPHLTTPILDDKSPSEQDQLFNGTYNLGFFACTSAAGPMLDWWERCCLQNGFSEGRTGLFVDQKWMNLLPGLFEKVAILRNPGLNMAYWNLHERALRGPAETPTVLSPSNETSEAPLCFFHFSGLAAGDPASLSRNTDRFTLADRPDLQPLFAHYKALLAANKQPAIESLPYGFDTLSDGTAITRLARRIYARHQQAFPEPDPFDAHGPFAAFARAEKLVAGKAAPAKNTWNQFSPTDRRVESVHRLLRFTLRRLGPNRYELLMRYLAHISVLRNQSVFLKPGNARADA